MDTLADVLIGGFAKVGYRCSQCGAFSTTSFSDPCSACVEAWVVAMNSALARLGLPTRTGTFDLADVPGALSAIVDRLEALERQEG